MPLHPDVEQFIREAVRQSGTQPAGGKVVEFGSYAMHGHDPRPLFPRAAEYIGVDARPGPGVDLVGMAHEVDVGKDARVVLSLQALEHDPEWWKTIVTCTHCVAPGGLVIITCAGPLWPKHEVETAPNNTSYYCNLSIRPILQALTNGLDLIQVHGRYIREMTAGHGGYRTCVWATTGSLV